MAASPPKAAGEDQEIGSGHQSAPTRVRSFRTPLRRLLADRVARWAVVGGGFAIIASILGILFFIVIEVSPVFSNAKLSTRGEVSAPGDPLLAGVVDEYRELALAIDEGGQIRALRLPEGTAEGSWELFEDESSTLVSAELDARGKALAALGADGRVAVVDYDFSVTFEGATRKIMPEVGDAEFVELGAEGRLFGPSALRNVPEDGTLLLVVSDPEAQRLEVVRRVSEENLFTGDVTRSIERESVPAPQDLTALAIHSDLSHLFAGTKRGTLVYWERVDGAFQAPQEFGRGGDAISSMVYLFGDGALVVGRESGDLEIWFPLRDDESGGIRLELVRRFDAHDAPIREIVPSRRDKGFLAIDESGTLGVYYSTSHRTLWKGSVAATPPRNLFFATKGDGALVTLTQGLVDLSIDNPHPDISLGSLFAPVWYENYEAPKYVWQSSSATDEFEPKTSLVPLLVGTLKGTLYSLVLAIPLGVLGAMYTSQFLSARLKRIVKPTVEIMAALPSVVLGFLAGLWLAPRVEHGFAALVLMALTMPLAVMGTGIGWASLPRSVRQRLPSGIEIVAYCAALLVAAWVALLVAGPFESVFFGGSLTQWISEVGGTPYDQRNAIVVGIAMGFAVIPIIFTVSEDAFSNVPRSLVSGSLAVGANRWQTVTRIVLPTASPGIFSAIMIGFGRAIGETMIVLMATGNTPIMDWSPFNGFRTLSANIAVEIPEAPVGGTLYRTLFLSALLLFVLTFLVNTIAELVRGRLRRRYANL